MRILVISDLPQFVTGGAEQQAANLIEAWLDAGHEVACFGRRMRTNTVRVGRHTVLVRRIRTVQRFGRGTRAASYFVSLCRLLLTHRNRFDLIYTRFLGEAAATVSVLKRLRLLDLPLVATPANTAGAGDANFLVRLPFGRRLVHLLDSQCDAINLIAPGMAKELLGIGFCGRNFTDIPNGVAIRAAPSDEHNYRHGLLAVGRATRQKGYDILIEALSLNRDTLQPGMVRIIGAGPEREALQAYAKALGVANAITWLGELDHASVLLELEQSQVFVLPSRYEGMSNAGLEAMERGLAMLVTRCGGLDTYIRPELGWVVEPEDATALAAALHKALASTPPMLANMGVRCRELVLREFGLHTVAARYLALFEHLIVQRSAAPAA